MTCRPWEEIRSPIPGGAIGSRVEERKKEPRSQNQRESPAVFIKTDGTEGIEKKRG